MQFVDTHCHIQSAGLSNGERATRELWAKAPDASGDQLVANAAAAGVDKLICVGCDYADSQLAVDFVQERSNCFASIGIHPHEAALVTEGIRTEFAKLVRLPKVIAVGECGLDYFYEHSPRIEQIDVLKFQLSLAVGANKPVIFHVRDAFDDFWPIFDSFNGKIRGVLHSFTDTEVNLQKAVERGLYIGVNGIATFAKQSAQQQMYKAIPSNRLLLETDAPFLTPVPFRGKINEPKQIKTIAEYLGDLRDTSIEEIARQTSLNSRQLFDI